MTTSIKIVLAVVLLLGSWQSFSLLASAAVTRQVDNHLRQLKTIQPVDLQIGSRRLQEVLNLGAPNPDALRLMIFAEPDPRRKLELLERLTEIRPADGQAWADIFSGRLALKQVDEQTGLALSKAMALGPWEPGVLFTLVDAGTRHWLTLDGAERQMIMMAAERRLVHSAHWRRGEFVGLLRSRGFLAMVCSRLESPMGGQSARQGYHRNVRECAAVAKVR
jgi:hypothetical protein